jgi:hypothetical protein
MARVSEKRLTKIITFDKASLKFICEALDIHYDKNIIAFTKKGAITKKKRKIKAHIMTGLLNLLYLKSRRFNNE